MRPSALLVLALLAAPAPLVAQAGNPHTQLDGRPCAACHLGGDSWRDVRFDHRQTGYQLRGRHLTVPCSGCHDVRDFKGAVTSCASCHQDPHRGDAGDRCAQCHTESGWRFVNPQDAHARSRLPDLGVHAALRCDDCHRQAGVQQFHGRVTPCVGCHQATFLATTNPPHMTLGMSRSCEGCHQMATWRFALFPSHDAVFRIYTGNHAGVWSSCASCHPVATDYQQYTCVTCHTDAQTTPRHAGIAGYQWSSPVCLTCHPSGGGADIGFHEAIFPVNAPPHGGTWGACSDCHTDPNNRAVVTCMGGACHVQGPTDASHGGIPGYSYTTAQCRLCHPDGRKGNFAQHDAVFPINTSPHAGTWTACSDCHTDPNNRQAITCISGGCHAQGPTNTTHNRIPGYGYTTAQCRSCHPDGRAGSFPQHDVIFPINSGSHRGRWSTCEQCHNVPGDRSQFTYVGSGCHNQTEMNNHHQGIRNYQPTPAACLSCHPTGRKP